MKIFIGSSSETIETVRSLTLSLKELGQEVVPWYDTSCFCAGRYTLESLFKISKKVDCAIFIFSKDDKIDTSECSGNKEYVTRDNVLFEYGYFMAKLGRNRVAIYNNNGAYIPSDLQGVTYFKSEEDTLRIEQRLKNWFEEMKEDENKDNYQSEQFNTANKINNNNQTKQINDKNTKTAGVRDIDGGIDFKLFNKNNLSKNQADFVAAAVELIISTYPNKIDSILSNSFITKDKNKEGSYFRTKKEIEVNGKKYYIGTSTGIDQKCSQLKALFKSVGLDNVQVMKKENNITIEN